MSPKKLSGIGKIAVLRANALGDFIFVLPALRALRETYPDAEITLLGKAWHKDFVPGRVDTVDRIMVIPPCRGVGEAEDYEHDESALRSFFCEAQEETFDLALQLHGGGRFSNPFVSQLGAKLTAGLQSADAPPLNITVPYAYYQNEILRFLEVVSCVGATTAHISPEVMVTAEDQVEVQQFTEGPAPYVILHPGASDPRRRWPAECFILVAEHFLSSGYRVFVTGVKSEARLAEAIKNGTGGRVISLVGRISLGGMAALLQQSALVISNDTGPLHLAEAVGAKTVGLYWCGNVINAGPMARSCHRPLLSWMVTGESHAKDDTSFVTGITVEECLAACESLLAT